MKLPGRGLGWKQFFKELKQEYANDRIGIIAGSLTFQGILALFPFILFLVALASLFIDPARAQQMVSQLGKVTPPDVTSIIGKAIQSLAQSQSGGLVAVSIIGAIWAASGGMASLIKGLNIVYGVEEQRPFWKVRGVAVLMTLFTAAIALTAGVVAIAAPALGDRIGGPIGAAITFARLPVAGVLMMFLWAVLYYMLPDVEQKFTFISPGSIAAVIIWVIASYGFSVYVTNFGNYNKTYGALGGIIVMLVWMWISAQVLLLGAEINDIIETHSPEGKKAGQSR